MNQPREIASSTILLAAVRGSIGIFVLRVGGTGLALLAGIFLARMLGVEGFGILAYTTAWVSVLLVVGPLGFQQLLPREVAKYQTQAEWGLLSGILEYSRRSVAAVCTGLAVTAALAAWVLGGFDTSSAAVTTLWIALVALPFSGLTRIRQGAMRGLGHVVRGMIPETFVAPVLSCTVLAVLYLAFDASLLPQHAVSIGLAITVTAFLIGNRMLSAVLPAEVRSAEPTMAKRAWLASAAPMVMITGLEVINGQMDIIMLGAMTSEKVTGIYSVAARGALLAVFIWAAINMAIGPIIARTYYSGDHVAMKTLIRKSAIGIFLFTLPVCAILFLFGEFFLSLFGPEFIAGKPALNILLIGYLVMTLAGSAGLILKMTGHERDVMWTGAGAALVNVTLNAVLIPSFGAEGAATATAVSLSVWALASCVTVYLRLGINPTFLGPWRFTLSEDHDSNAGGR